MKHGVALGRDISLDELRRDYDAVFLGVGLGGDQQARPRRRRRARNVVDAVDYIAELRQAEDLSELPVGRRVVVIGGGMTAVDVAVQSKRLGAEIVTIAYRRGQDAHEGERITSANWRRPSGVADPHLGAAGRDRRPRRRCQRRRVRATRR